MELPPMVLTAQAQADRLGFDLSSEPEVGRLIAFFSNGVPSGGRVLELGTGSGVGLAWIVHGIGERTDVEVVSVELDGERAVQAQAMGWPEWVSIIEGDGADVVGTLGSFDLIFPDAPGGKIFKLRKTIADLRAGGVILVDDMDLSRHSDPELRNGLATVKDRLLQHPDLICAELPFASGVIVARRRKGDR
ncbi:MAG: class I SAM-dependent methyltransferase [Acidimicrobiales bacterium]|nr:class I SAM-dependent methyltransferase [Acidimicrobiales bacterium]